MAKKVKKAGVPKSGIKCQCHVCKRSHRFIKIVSSLPDKDRKWMTNILNTMLDTEERLELMEAHDEMKRIAVVEEDQEEIRSMSLSRRVAAAWRWVMGKEGKQ